MTREKPGAAEAERVGGLLGALAALLAAGWFYYAVGAPLQNLALCAIITVTGVAAAGVALRRAEGRARWLACAGSLPVAAAAALALWALARWLGAEVRTAGAEWTLGLLWMAVAAAAGMSLAVAAGLSGPGGTPALARVLRRGLTLAGLLFALHGLAQYFHSYDALYRDAMELARQAGRLEDPVQQGILHTLREKRVGGRLWSPNLFAAQLALLAPLALGTLAMRQERTAWRALGGVALGAILWAALLTGSRGGLLTMAAVLAAAVAAAWWTRWGTKRGFGAAAVAAGMTAGALALAPRMASAAEAVGLIERIGRIDTIRERLFYWEIALRVWARRPLTGEGPGSFELLYAALKSPAARESQYVHSWVLQTGAELGCVGVVLYAAFWVGLAMLAWRALRGKRNGGRGNRGVSLDYDYDYDYDYEHEHEHELGRGRENGRGREMVWLLIGLLGLCFNGLFEFALQWRAFLAPAGMLAGICVGLGGSLVGAAPAHATRPRALWRGWAGATLAAGALAAALTLTPQWQIARYHEWQAGLLAGEQTAEAAFGTLRAWEKALALEPENWELTLGKARTLAAMGEVARAEALARRAGELNPHSASARAERARMLMALGRPEEALAAAREALERYPSSFGHRMLEAEILLRLGRREKALEVLEGIERDAIPMYDDERARLARMKELAD